MLHWSNYRDDVLLKTLPEGLNDELREDMKNILKT